MKRWVLIVVLSCAGVASAEDFYHDFRKQPLPVSMSVFPKKEGLVKVEPEGLRITIPREWIHPFGGVGVRAMFEIKGDFDIITTFEVLEAETPTMGYGVGAMLRVEKSDVSPGLANLCRLVKAGEKQLVLWEYRMGPPGGKGKYGSDARPFVDKSGRLRMTRTGALLELFVGPVDGERFELVRPIDFGTEDLKHVELVALTGRQPCKVEVRFLDLRITSPGLKAPQVKVAQVEAPKKPVVEPQADAGGGWIVWAAAAAVGGLAIALVIWVMARRPSGTESATDAAEVECPQCAKRLRVSSKVLGRKIKCPKCAMVFVAES